MSYELKIKAKELAAEAKEIRKEEKRLYTEANTEGNSSLRYQANELHWKRVYSIRDEARSVQLARTFLKGRKRSVAEKKPCFYPVIIIKTLEQVRSVKEVDPNELRLWLIEK